MFEVIVKTLDGNSKTFQIEDDDRTVAAFKEMIATEMNIPIENQRLIFQGKVLVDDRILKECDVESKTIHLVPRPPPQPNAAANISPSPSTGEASQRHFAVNRLRFQGIRRAVQNVTHGLLSGLQDFSHPSDVAMRTDNEGNIDIRFDIPFMGLREDHFRRLLRQATNVLNTLDGVTETSRSESSEVPSASTDSVVSSDPIPSSSNASTQAHTGAAFTRLAEMMAEQRRLWERIQPHLHRWEGMLRSEQEFQARIISEENISGVPPTGSTNDDKVVQQSEWNQRYFNQISFLLHLNSHMLHLLSDFAVGSPRSQTPTVINETQTSANTTSSTAESAPDTATESATLTSRRSLLRRIVLVPESESPIVHAHINIEPTVVAFSRSTGRVSTTSRSEAADGANNTEESVRRRSQSAHPPAPPIREGTVPTEATLAESSFDSPTAFIIETPADASTENITRTQSTFNPTEILQSMVGAFNNAAAQVSRHSTQPQQPTSQPQSRVESTMPPGSATTESVRPPMVLPLPLFPTFSGSRMARGGEASDPFLPCNSRHFAYVSAGGSSRRRSRPVVGVSQRRGRSAGPQIEASRTARPPTNAVFNSQATNLPTSTTSVHSVTIPLGPISSFSSSVPSVNPNFTDFASHLNQVFTTGIGGLVRQQRGPGDGFVMGPFTWVINPLHGEGVQVVPGNASNTTISTPTPPVPDTYSTNEELAGDTHLIHLPSVLMEGVLQTIWSYIIELASDQLPLESVPSANLASWVPPNSVMNSSVDRQSPFYETLLQMRNSLCFTGRLSTEALSNSSIGDSLDHLRQPLRRLLPTNFEEERDATRDTLARTLLANCVSDEACADPNEQELVAWAARISGDLPPIDLRRSLLNFLTHRVMSQMSLWYHSPTNSAFGNLLLSSLKQSAVDLLGFADFLTRTAAIRLGLRLNQQPDSYPNGRLETFGHSMSLHPITRHLTSFMSSLPEGDDQRFVEIFRTGIARAMWDYTNLGASSLSVYVGSAPLSLIACREITPAAGFVSDGNSVIEAMEDSDVSDAYVDACEDGQIGAATSASVRPNPSLDDPLSLWSVTENLPVDPLAESPQSQWSAPSTNTLPSVPPSFPQQWTAIVSGDVARMSVIGSSQASSPTANSTEGEDLDVDDLDPSVCRLSDAYIAGMPSKRRKLMLEKKNTLACPINQLFMKLLTDATLPTSAENADIIPEQPQSPPLPPRNVTEAFKAYVSDHLSRRLADDPDFDPEQQPAARDVFGAKRNTKKE